MRYHMSVYFKGLSNIEARKNYILVLETEELKLWGPVTLKPLKVPHLMSQYVST